MRNVNGSRVIEWPMNTLSEYGAMLVAASDVELRRIDRGKADAAGYAYEVATYQYFGMLSVRDMRAYSTQVLVRLLNDSGYPSGLSSSKKGEWPWSLVDPRFGHRFALAFLDAVELMGREEHLATTSVSYDMVDDVTVVRSDDPFVTPVEVSSFEDDVIIVRAPRNIGSFDPDVVVLDEI